MFDPKVKPYIDITHLDEWEVDFTVHTGAIQFSARQFEPTFPNAILAGKREIMICGFSSDHYAGVEGARELAHYLSTAHEMIIAIGVLGARLFLESHQDLVRRR